MTSSATVGKSSSSKYSIKALSSSGGLNTFLASSTA
eukprot:CAMPEP_0194132102 /NCGR_PEP_ID=MMETSP0152-20130528/2655_1 /TAXON_ID=1049557 /ORGANISM="Thalassiothrix antarctica, Strain L6-D1" /LENGTH=35 /DNA_ID= /DNA_START= /DNA_END= /DNA_ORIENTATION=